MAPPQDEDPVSGLERSIVLVGLMGAGKSCIGRSLALRLGRPFIDADREIEAALRLLTGADGPHWRRRQPS